MSITFYINTDPTYYGSDCTDEEADRASSLVMQHAQALYPDVDFQYGEGRHDYETLDESERIEEIQQAINDHWADWISEV